MGTKMAPSYANTFMSRLEKQLLQSVSLKPFSWLRFIDDIDMKWTHGRETLEKFLRDANNFHPTIKFTAEVFNDNHVFLDTTSHLEGDRVVVDLYTKPTDSHQYLRAIPFTDCATTVLQKELSWLSFRGDFPA